MTYLSDLHKDMKPHPGTHQREVIAHMHTHTYMPILYYTKASPFNNLHTHTHT